MKKTLLIATILLPFTAFYALAQQEKEQKNTIDDEERIKELLEEPENPTYYDCLNWVNEQQKAEVSDLNEQARALNSGAMLPAEIEPKYKINKENITISINPKASSASAQPSVTVNFNAASLLKEEKLTGMAKNCKELYAITP